MIKKKIITRISNEIGNQLFMYASTLAIAKKLNRDLFIDDESSFRSRKNISNYGLKNFTISSQVADKKYKFLGLKGYLKRKLLKKIDFFFNKKNFYIEKKNINKITKFDDNILDTSLTNIAFFEGYFETQKYFLDIKNEIVKEFNFKKIDEFKKSFFYEKLNRKNSVSICLRQNRFIEGKDAKNSKYQIKSDIFRDEQINYINKSIIYLKKNIDNPSFYLWSNDLDNIDMSLFNNKILKINHDQQFLLNLDKRALDLFLISKCNHHIVIPSSFNWWGAWLSQSDNKIVCRPSDDFFSSFEINNLDFWPNDWIKIS